MSGETQVLWTIGRLFQMSNEADSESFSVERIIVLNGLFRKDDECLWRVLNPSLKAEYGQEYRPWMQGW